MDFGLYEKLMDSEVKNLISELHNETRKVDKSESAKVLATAYYKILRKILSEKKDEEKIEFVKKLNKEIGNEILYEGDKNFLELLAVHDDETILKKLISDRPKTSISSSTLFTGYTGPTLESELRREIRTADRIDFIVSFIKYSGLVLIYDDLVEFTKNKKLRIITTSYMGASDYKAIEKLSQLPNTEVKISYDTNRTRLHAKAYYFERNTGFSTAYIGSSNISNPALSKGLEWNLKVSEYTSKDVVDSIIKTFETYWNDDEFRTFMPGDEEDKKELKIALSKREKDDEKDYVFFDLRPFSHQKEILEDLRLEREEYVSYKNLVVAATGSGKSYSMVFYTACLVKELNNPTIVVITDRNDLDDQLFDTFSKSADILRQTPKQADVRKLTELQKSQQLNSNSKEINGLYDLLNDRESGGIIFTTIQKFTPEKDEMPILTDRKNVIIIADEAHRSQYGLKAKTDLKTGDVKYGYARYLRDALPNASFIGFTGTPIDLDDRSTTAVFGHCIDTYDMTRAVEDEATVKIYYENRVIKLDTDDEELQKIDQEFEEVTEGQEEFEREKNKSKWSRLEAVVGSPNRVKKLAEDIVNYYENKSKAIDGKAMVVCMSRRICVDLYDEIINLRPDWHSDDIDKGKIKVVMSGSAADNERLQKHIGSKQRRDLLAKRMKDNSDELKIVIVRDMWLTGFDVPSMHTMFIDKPMEGHTLMQAIARVNRVFKDKSGGVIVDYLGILDSLKRALKQYTDKDKRNTGIDTSVAISIMNEKLEILQDIMHGLDYSDYMGESKAARMRAITGGMDFILGKPLDTQRNFKQIAVELAKAHSLCAATEEGQAKALEVSYFKAVKASLTKLQERGVAKKSKKEVEARINQMLERSIISEDVIDVFDVLGLKQPEVSILSEDFLKEVRELNQKNLAVEMLKKLLEGSIKTMERTNLVKSEKFSEKLKIALNRYHNQAITNAEVIEELIKMAHEMKRFKDEERDLGLNEDEIAFYDALTADEVVKEFMTDEVLKKIAQELTVAIRNNVTIDWSIRRSAQAGMRRIIKRLLAKYDYPPGNRKSALDIVMRQAEKMSGNVYEENFQLSKVAEDNQDYLLR